MSEDERGVKANKVAGCNFSYGARGFPPQPFLTLAESGPP